MQERRAQDHNEQNNVEDSFMKFFMCVPVAASISSCSNGVYVQVNDVFLEKTGYERHEVIGRSSMDLNIWICKEHRKSMLDNLDNHIPVRNQETRFRMKNGAIKDCVVSADLIFIDKEKNYLFFIQDYTGQKEADRVQEINARRTEALLQLNQMTLAPLKKITDFALEEAVRITGSTIGYLAFLNEDETILTMHSWSKNAMSACYLEQKPLVYQVAATGLWGEAVRQRRPVITNEYHAPNPSKKGYPDGHVPITRHFNIPVFAGAHIVLIAGVGNKEDDYDESDVKQLTLLMEGMWMLIERKQKEEKLRESEEKYHSLIENMQGAVFRFDLDNNLRFANSTAAQMFGYPSVESMIGKNIRDLYNQPELVDDHIRLLFKQGSIKHLEVVLKRKDNGHLVVVSINTQLYCDTEGQIIGFEGMCNDISDRKKAEEVIQRSEQRFKTLFMSINECFYISEILYDQNGNPCDFKYLDVNPKFEQLLGMNREQIIGKTYREITSLNNPQWMDIYFQVARTGLPMSYEFYSNEFRKFFITSAYLSDKDQISVFVMDITERKKSEEQIKKLVSLQKTILDTVTVGLEYFVDGKVGWTNTVFNNMFQVGIQEVYLPDGSTYNKLEDIYQKIREWALPFFIKGETFSIELKHRLNNDKLFWCYIVGKAINRHNLTEGSIWMAQDITNRKLAEAALLKSDLLLKATMESMNEGLLVVTSDGKITHTNTRFKNLFNITEDIYNLNDDSVLSQYATKQLADPIGFAKKVKEIYKTSDNSEDVFLFKDGRTIERHSYPLTGDSPVKGRVWIFRDITERKMAEALIQAKEAKLRSIFLAVPVAVGLTINRSFQECNDTFYNMTGYIPEEVIGKNARFLYPTEDEFAYVGRAQLHQMGKQSMDTLETMWLLKNGQVINILLRFVALNTADFKQGVVFAALDITDRKHTEQKVKELNRELEKKVEERTAKLNQTNKDLESFAYSISHDLRAPVRHINGYTNLLYARIENPDESMKDYYQRIELATQRMSSMIDSLLSFSRLGRKELTLSMADTKLIVREIIEQFGPDIAKRDIKWEIGQLPKIYGDTNLLKLAFENLISNAIKYTLRKQKTVISIGSRVLSDDRIEFYIKDNGVGFDMTYGDKLFGVFQRLHATSEFEGIGIGLANVKRIVEKHYGTVRAKGKVNKGATFFMTLPNLEHLWTS